MSQIATDGQERTRASPASGCSTSQAADMASNTRVHVVTSAEVSLHGIAPHNKTGLRSDIYS